MGADYTAFLHDIGSRIGDEGVWPHHTMGPYSPFAPTKRTCADDVSFCKANMSAANPTRRSIHPTVINIWTGAGPDGGCVVVVDSTLPTEAHAKAGAPKSVVTKLTVSANGTALCWDVVQVNKRPTRLPESTFFTFNPLVQIHAAGGSPSSAPRWTRWTWLARSHKGPPWTPI